MGQCTPARTGCFDESAGFATCHEFCESMGDACSGPDVPGLDACAHAVELHEPLEPSNCRVGKDLIPLETECNSPIPFGFVWDDTTYNYASCCCVNLP
jgi:hypothetical protein